MTDKFFKIPVEKLLDKISISGNIGIDFNESQWGMVAGLEEHRFWVHISARRTGKSLAAAILAFAKMLEPGMQVMVVAPNFSLSSIIWDYVTDIIKNLGIEVERLNQKDKIIKLINGSTFRLLSANNRDSLVGRAANLIIIDEAAIIPDDEYYNRDLRPALSTFSDSRALFISTPRGQGNYLFDFFSRGDQPEFPDWGSGIYTWRTNPLLNKNDIAEAAKSISHKMYMQEYECSWTTTEMQVYSLNKEIHLKDLQEVKDRLYKYEIIAGLDVGYRDRNAFVVIATDGETFYVLDEYIAAEVTTSVLAEQVKELEEKWGVEMIYIDSAAQQLKADFAYDYDIYTENAIKSVNDGINHICALIEHDKLIFDETTALNSFRALSSYKWNQKTETPKTIHDEHSHASDAIRYAIYTHVKKAVNIFA
tara:strand:+ start:17 stop:1282 length:1266 start_codon:yes stop_codon:yes gene_type:complete